MRLLFLTLITLLCCACKSDSADTPFVTDVSLSPASGSVAPGDEVTVTAQGLEPDDQLMLRITWPLADELFPEGYADGILATVTAHTATQITFLTPGGCPAGTLHVKLLRHGKTMLLGDLPITDGQPPKSVALYALTHLDNDVTKIERIDMTSGERGEVVTLGVGKGFRCATNRPGSNTIQGLAPGNGAAYYDLTMRYGAVIPERGTVAAGNSGKCGFTLLSYSNGFVWPFSPSGTRSPMPALGWRLPEGITPEMLSCYPFVPIYRDAWLMLSVRRAEGIYTWLLLNTASREVLPGGEDMQADAMVPVSVFTPDIDGNPFYEGYFAVANNGKTELRPLRSQSQTLGHPEAEVPGTVCSLTECVTGAATQDIYLLCGESAQKQIHVLGMPSKTLRTLPGTFSCDEIVLAR